MNLTTTLIIGCAAISIYIAFLVLGFSLKGKNLKAQNLKDKEQILGLKLYFCFFNSVVFVDSNNPKIIAYKPIKNKNKFTPCLVHLYFRWLTFTKIPAF